MGRKFNTRCYLDVAIGDGDPERIVLELFDDKCPKACDNFKKLCEGVCGIGMKTGKPLHYKGSMFHRIIKGFIIQGGDFSNGDGTGGESIYGGTFADEDMSLAHDRPFLLSMANRGPNTNGSQFFITTAPAPHLNGKHMIFGHVLSGQEVVAKIESVPVSDTRVYKPLKPTVIVNCGELIPVKKKISKHSKKSIKKKKEKKKKHKKKKKSKKHRYCSSGSESDSDSNSVKVRPEEIPDVPQNKFLYRPGPSDPTQIKFGTNQNNAVSKSGRKVKGRGQVRYRSPNVYTGGSGRAYTPEHWHQASRNENYHRANRDDYRTHANRFADAMGIDRNEERISKAVLRSPLNGHERSSRHNRARHHEDTRDMSKNDRHRESRNNDRSDRRIYRYADDRRMRDQDLSPPPYKRFPIDYSSQGEDERRSYPRPSPSIISRDYKDDYSKRREKSASNSPLRKSTSSPTRWESSRKRSLSGSQKSPLRPAKRCNDHYPDSKTTSERKREVSGDRSPSGEKQHVASRSPPAYLVSKWEERHRENQRKRESMKRIELGRRNSDVDDIAISSSPALKPNTSRCRRGSSSASPPSPRTQRSPSKRTASPKPVLVNSSMSPEKQSIAVRSPLLKAPPSPITLSPIRPTAVPDEAVLPKKPRSPLLSPPSHIKSPVVTNSKSGDSYSPEVKPPSNKSPSKREWSSSSKENKKEVLGDVTSGDQEATGPWTTSRWQTDEAESSAQASSTKKSPVKLALGGSSNAENIHQPIDMDMSDVESDAKQSEPPAEKKSPTSPAKSSKAPSKKIRSRSVSSSESSTTSTSSRSRTRRPSRSIRSSSSSSSSISRSHSRRRSSGSIRSRRSRRNRIRSSSRSRSRRRRKMSSSRSSISRRRHSRRRRIFYTRSSSRDRSRCRRRRSSSSAYSRRRRRRSYSSYSSASSRSTYSSVSRRR
nr:peptidyl prolyl isomerase G [Hymenolepis microstoma]